MAPEKTNQQAHCKNFASAWAIVLALLTILAFSSGSSFPTPQPQESPQEEVTVTAV